MKNIKLEWGESPFDKLSRDELLHAAQRLYMANESMLSCLRILKGDDLSPYWGDRGAGGRAIEKGTMALLAVSNGFDSESIYRAFFRYAGDLLFGPRLGANWFICSACGVMVGPMWPESEEGKSCDHTKDCAGIYRRIIWDDLKPLPAVPTPDAQDAGNAR